MSILVVDANVLISAAVFGGTPRRFLVDLPISVRLVIPASTAEEARSRLRSRYARKFAGRGPLPELAERLETIIGGFDIVEPTLALSVSRDPDDDRLLALAVEVGATAVVTGDKDLLVLTPFRGLRILTPAEAWRDFCQALHVTG